MSIYRTLLETVTPIVTAAQLEAEAEGISGEGIAWTGTTHCTTDGQVWYLITLPGSWDGAMWYNADGDNQDRSVFI